MGILPKIIGWALIFYCGYCVFLFLMQRSILFPRNQIPFPTDTGVAIPGLEKIWLDTEFGKIETWYLPPVSGPQAKPAPAVIFGHGNGELIDYWPQALQNFNQMGIGLLLVEYPGYGRSSGTPSEQSITARLLWRLMTPWYPEKRSIHPGLSCSADPSAEERSVHWRVERPSAALILMSTFTSVQSMASKFLGA